MIFKQLFDPATSTFTYLLADPVTREAAIIDPVLEQTDRDLRLVAELGLELRYALDTHVHADHITGSGKLRKLTGAVTVVSEAAQVACVDRPVQNGDRLPLGSLEIEVRSTPGHTSGCVTYVVSTGDQVLAFTGDALFIGGSGRTDFQQGDAKKLYRSVRQQIFTLPDHTLIYPGHDYRGNTSSTVAAEKAHNPRLGLHVSEDEFVRIMNELNLPNPKQMDVAVPANMACGQANANTNGNTDADTASAAIAEVDPASLRDLGAYRVVDVRDPEELFGELGHIEGAHSAPLDDLPARAQAWDRGEPLLLVCRSGRRSYRACTVLRDMGFTNVTNLGGGMMAWREAYPKVA